MADLRLQESVEVMPVRSWKFVYQPTAPLPTGTTVVLKGNFEADFETENPDDLNKGWDKEYPTTFVDDTYEVEIPNLYIGQQYEYKFKITYPNGRIVWWPNGKNSVVVIPELLAPDFAAGPAPMPPPPPAPVVPPPPGPVVPVPLPVPPPVPPPGPVPVPPPAPPAVPPVPPVPPPGPPPVPPPAPPVPPVPPVPPPVPPVPLPGPGPAPVPPVPPPGPPPVPPPVPPVAPPVPPVPPLAPPAGPPPVPPILPPGPPAPRGRRLGRILGISAGVLAAVWCVARIQHCRGYDEGIEKNMDDVRAELFKRLVDIADLELPDRIIRVYGTVRKHADAVVFTPQTQMVVMDKCGKEHPATIKIIKTRPIEYGYSEGTAIIQVTAHNKSYTYRAIIPFILDYDEVVKWSSEATLSEE